MVIFLLQEWQSWIKQQSESTKSFVIFLKKVHLCCCCKKNEGTIQYLSVENMEESDDDDYDFDDDFGDCEDNSPC